MAATTYWWTGDNVLQLCHFIEDEGQIRCSRCQLTLRSGAPLSTRRHCHATCRHLGPPVEKDGVTIKVKCTCQDNEKGYTEQWHTAHECSVYKRCLPTLRQFDDNHQPEAAIYQICYGCTSFTPKE